ncbi:MAG: hypothetical protein LC781_04790 [Actinobacteria bacterium]|nr:hypothetical protein [Actinomycetota bacterium]
MKPETFTSNPPTLETERLLLGPLQGTTIDAKAVEALRARFRGALLRPGEEGYDEARRVDDTGRFVEIYPTGPSSGTIATAQPDGSLLAGRAPGQAERLSPLLTIPSGLGGILCAS